MPYSTEKTTADHLAGVESLLAGLDQKAGPMDARAKQQAAVLAFGRRTTVQPPLNVLLEDAAAMIAEVLELDRIGVGQVVESGSALAFRIATLAKQGVLTDVLHHQYSQDSTCSMAAYTLQAGAPISTKNLLEETRFTDLFLRNMRVGGALMLPLVVGGKPFGVLGVFARQERSFTMEDIQFAETISYLLISSLARIKAEEELQQHQSIAQSVMEMIDAFVVTLDHEGRILQINPTLQKIAGFSLEEIQYRPFWDVFVTPEQVEMIHTLFRKTRSEKNPIEFESHLLDKSGQKRRVCWTLKPLAEGNEQKMVLCGLDQTETIHLKEELRKVYQRTQQTSKVIQELCAGLQTDPTSISPALVAALHELAQPIERQPLPFHPLRSFIPDEHRQFVRRFYRYRQKIAPYSEGQFPRPEDFVAVQCKDISAGGIGFFMEKEPSFRRLVVVLGEGETASYFLAEVVRSIPVEHQGQNLFLIGCKFCGRITPPPDFKPAAPSK
ncbi:MAG TPA: PAS domain S-box protein [Thermoguttaceae bacterium]|nr:PAS domain S-box protein [Thermoguttaceae bacterium]